MDDDNNLKDNTSEAGEFPAESTDPYLSELDHSLEDLMSEEPTRSDIPAEVPPPAPQEKTDIFTPDVSADSMQEPTPPPPTPEPTPQAPMDATPAAEFPEGPALTANIPVTVHAVVGGKETTLADLLALKNGEVVELGKGLDTHVDLMVQDQVIAKGELVDVGGRLGVRINQVVEKSK